MRKFLVLAMITALCGWALKRLVEVGADDAFYEGARRPTGDRVGLEPQPPDDFHDESLGASDEETRLEPQVADDTGDEKTPSGLDEEVPLESQSDEGIEVEALEASSEEVPEPQPLNDPWSETTWPPAEEADLESQPAEERALDAVEDRAPPDVAAGRRHRGDPQAAKDEWPLPAGPDGEERLRRTRSEVDKRLRNLPEKRRRRERHAA
jgi:hypothetical protein